MTERTLSANYQPSLSDLKTHVRVTSSDLDAQLTADLLAAINSAEHMIGKIIALSQFVRTGSFASTLRLKAPLVSVTSVVVDGVTLSSSDWSVEGNILTVTGVTSGTSMTVTYTSGMSSVPYDMKAAILLHAAALFNNPVDSVETLAKASDNLLRPYRSWGIEEDGEQD